MNILKDIAELVENEVITQDVANKIKSYYSNKKIKPFNGLFIVFGVLGAILVGLGIILIVAHNWDEFNKTVKSIFAFIPLLIGQLICIYVLMKKNNSTAWSESSSAFLFFAVGVSIALIGQIYNIPGNTASYLFTWMLLCLPMVYIMRSSIVSLLYIAGITFFAVSVTHNEILLKRHAYWFMLLSIIPYYYNLIKNKPQSNFLLFHHWFIPVSFMIALNTIDHWSEHFIFVAYMSLFGLFYIIGNLHFFEDRKIINNSYKILSSLGTVIVMLVVSFKFLWFDLHRESVDIIKWLSSSSFYAAIIISIVAIIFFVFKELKKGLKNIDPMTYIFILFIAMFTTGFFVPAYLVQIFVNITIFALGIYNIVKGIRNSHFGILNFGLLIIAMLTIFRFFDTELSFVLRGILFLTIGIGFFATNFQMLKKKNKQ